MPFQLPRVEFRPDADIEAPLMSIVTASPGVEPHRTPLRLYLAECSRQSTLALAHLDQAWVEAEKATLANSNGVWRELQGAMTAGIILSRLLSPSGVYARPPLSKAKSNERSESRGKELRQLLKVSLTSPLVTIARIRNPIEHFDERIDGVVESGAYSVSDWFVTKEGYIGTGASTKRTVGLRMFAPGPGLLIFDDITFDLFAYEEALHELQLAVPEASAEIDRRDTGSQSCFGEAQLVSWNLEDIHERQQQWALLRQARGARLHPKP